MKWMTRIALGFVLAVAPITMTGCWTVVAAGGAAGGVAYAKGDLEATVDASPQAVAKASNAALEELSLMVLNSRASDLDAEILARSAQDKKITIKIKRLTDTTSKISIRVGPFGDQAMSQAIYEKIKARL